MAYQKRRAVLKRTKFSYNALLADSDSLVVQIDAAEIEAYEEERYYEAFVLQFSFLERYLRSVINHYAKKLNMTAQATREVRTEQSVAKLITYFELILSSFVDSKNKDDFKALSSSLRDHNLFRNDLLHHCADSRKFENVIHIEQSLLEAYDAGLEILKLFTKLKMKSSDGSQLVRSSSH